MPEQGCCLPSPGGQRQDDQGQNRRVLVCILLICLALWVWVLAETVIFLLIVKNVQHQNILLEEQFGVLLDDVDRLRDEAADSAPVRMRRDSPSYIDSDARFVHFLNLELSLALTSDGAVQYWMPSHTGYNPCQLKVDDDFSMSSDGSRVEVLSSGLYMIYAQLDWDLAHNEVGHLHLRSATNSRNADAAATVLAACTVGGKAVYGVDERTCYTSAVAYLHRNQQIWVSTSSPDAQLNGAPEKSFFGLVKL